MTHPTEHAPRTMTRSQVRALIAGELTPCQEELLDALVDEGVIQNDPQPRPDFEFMDHGALCNWIVCNSVPYDYYTIMLNQPHDFGNQLRLWCNAIADRLNLAPVRNGATDDK